MRLRNCAIYIEVRRICDQDGIRPHPIGQASCLPQKGQPRGLPLHHVTLREAFASITLNATLYKTVGCPKALSQIPAAMFPHRPPQDRSPRH